MSKTCCGYICKQGKTGDEYGVWCETCGKRGKGKTSDAAEKAFDMSTPGIVVLDNARKLPAYVSAHAKELVEKSAPFVQSDRPLFNYMIKRNVEYVMSLKGQAYDKIWETKEGQESYLKAFEYFLLLGASLPEMGSIVPAGSVVIPIPDVEAFKFSVTTGSSAPFEWFEITLLYKNDIYKVSDKPGEFYFNIEKVCIPRGEIIAVIPHGKLKDGRMVGKVYEVPSLIGKAETHSPSYRFHLHDIAAFEAAKMEGKVETDEGREYIWRAVKSKAGDKYAAQDAALFQAAEKDGKLKKDAGGEYTEKTIPGKDGKPDWKKKLYRSDIENPGTEKRKVYRDELINPYDGADRPEMLRKLAGKSFLAPYIKTRNSTAAINELSESDDVSAMLDNALEAAYDVLPGDVDPSTPSTNAATDALSDDVKEEELF